MKAIAFVAKAVHQWAVGNLNMLGIETRRQARLRKQQSEAWRNDPVYLAHERLEAWNEADLSTDEQLAKQLEMSGKFDEKRLRDDKSSYGTWYRHVYAIQHARAEAAFARLMRRRAERATDDAIIKASGAERFNYELEKAMDDPRYDHLIGSRPY